MKSYTLRALGAFLLVTGAAAVSAATVSGTQLTVSGWAYGSGNKVAVSSPVGSYNGFAGGFAGSLVGAGALSSNSFIAYCIELEEQFYFSSAPLAGYGVVEGTSYFSQRRGDAGIADRLGRLMTYVADNPSLVADAAGSTALQLAIWNTVYDTDDNVAGNRGSFNDDSRYQGRATALLAGTHSVTASRYDVFALQAAGSQDFLAVSLRSSPAPAAVGDVPEPGTLGLAGAALAGGFFAARRRRR